MRKNNKKYGTNICSTIPIPAGSLEKLVKQFIKDLFKDPNYMLNFQKEVDSSRKYIKHIKERKRKLQRVYEGLPGRDDAVFKKQLKELDETRKKVSKDLSDATAEINRFILQANHIQSFLDFSDKYRDRLDEVLLDRDDTYDLIHMLIEEVVIESRNTDENDPKRAGRKKKGQMLPFALHFKFY